MFTGRRTEKLARSTGPVMAALAASVAGTLYAIAPPAGAAATFSAAPDFRAGAAPADVVVADFNGDGKADLMTANASGNNLSVFLGDGVGNFSFRGAVEVNFPGTPLSVAVGDFNGDGKIDVAEAEYGFRGVGTVVSVYLGDGTGAFSPAADVTVGIGPQSVAVADFNGDGKADLAVASGIGTVSIRLGAGDGTFSGTLDVPVGGDPRSVAVADFNGDAKADFVTANHGTNNVSVRLNDGLGGFSAAADLAAAAGPESVALGDFNGDTNVDLAVTNLGFLDGTTVSIRLGNGAGGFSVAPDLAVGTPHTVAVGDFDGDARADLAVTNYLSNAVSVRLGDGAGGFTGTLDLTVGASPGSVAVGDFNGDDHADLAVINGDNISIRMNQDTTVAAPPVCRIRAVFAGPPKQIVVGASDLRSGIRSIVVTTNINATVRVEPFAPMAVPGVEIKAVAAKINQSLSAQVAFVITDGAGRQASCF